MTTVRIIATAAFLSLAGAAAAQSLSGSELVNDQFRQFESAGPESILGRYSGRLNHAESATGTFIVPAGSPALVRGFCDERCSNLDLVVRDAAGNEVGADLEGNDQPMVLVLPGAGGSHTVEIRMSACSSPCEWGTRVYADLR
ncbi:MAG: hypothetical protein FD125_1931 [bacterium]|nr:MAG: hypothetical protein FD125_1931 [bacterium]